MSEKMMKLIRTMEEQMNTQIVLYQHNFKSYELALVELKEVRNRFERLRSDLFLFDMLSQSDYINTSMTAYDMYDKYHNKLLSIYYSK